MIYLVNFKKSLFCCVTFFCFFLFTRTFLTAQVSQEWAARYNNGSADQCYAMAVDASGNVFVTGSSRSGGLFTEDIATIKYSAGGTMLWTRRYAGIGSGEDYGYAIAVDASGNVYVTGRTWVSAASNNDIVTIKYNSAGDSIWVKRYNGTKSNSDEGFAVTLDASGNVYVAGMSQGLVGPNGIFDDLVVLKYSPSGTELWNYRYNGPSGGLDKATSVAVDPSGNVYAAGTSWGGSGSMYTRFDIVTVKLNSSGLFQWVDRFDGPGNSDDEGRIIKYYQGTVSTSGVYVTGYSFSSTTGKDFRTIKYSTGGTMLWSSAYNGPNNGLDEAYGLAVDASGNAYLTGKSDGGSTSFDIATVKYNLSGVQQWAQRFNGTSGTDDQGNSIALDSSNNVYVAGYSMNPTTAQDYQTIKYSTSGVLQWQVTYTNGSSAGSPDAAVSVFASNSGSVYAAGSSALDYAVVKYSQSLTGIGNNSNLKPHEFILSQNYPNPFNPSTVISFQVPDFGHVSLKVYDVSGREVAVPVDKEMNPGSYGINFDASKLSSGIYFYTLRANGFAETKKMMLIK